jgi:hypothetical protein
MSPTMRILVLAALAAGAAPAQHTNGYFYGGVSTMPGRQIYTYWHGEHIHVGGGGQIGIGRFTLGADITGLIAVSHDYTRNAAIGSAGAGFHFFNGRGRKLDPFVTGGVSILGARGGVAGMIHYGGGANYWFRRRIALRVEFRDHIWPTEGERVHFSGVRAGLTFR